MSTALVCVVFLLGGFGLRALIDKVESPALKLTLLIGGIVLLIAADHAL